MNRGAIIDLIREAEMLASMRHPNIVWVYGELRLASAVPSRLASRPVLAKCSRVSAAAALPTLCAAMVRDCTSHAANCPAQSAQSPTAIPHCLAGIVLPSLTSDAKARGSSRSESPSSSPEGSGEAEAAAIDAAMHEEATEARNGARGGGAGREGRGGSKGGGGGSKDVVDAIASGMQRSGMQPGMVRPPAMVTGGWGVGAPVAQQLCVSGIPLLFRSATHV